MMAEKNFYKFSALGIDTQVPRWALHMIAVILVVGVGWAVYQKVYAQPERELITAQEAAKQMAQSIEEFGLHIMEEPQKHELFEDTDGKLMLRVFKDHCVLIQRQTRRGVKTKLVVDLDRELPQTSYQIDPPAKSWSILPVLEAQNNCNRGCLNPHPGQFRWWYGERRGEWVEIYRQWPDGCTHFQLFQPRTGVWDSNPDGSPRIFWRCCVH